MEERYYFAYGSNMNLEQMKYRCPAAEVVENVRLEDCLLYTSPSPRDRG